MKKLVSIFLLASTTISSVASADVDSSDPWKDVAGITPLRRGQKAPYSGVLMTPKATATIVANADTEREKISIEVQHALAEADTKRKFEVNETTTKCTADKGVLQASIDEKNARIKIVEEELSKASDPPSRTTWAGIGFVGGVVTTVLIIFGVSRVTK
jgi:hypothetical protein